MESTLLQNAASQGLWALLFVALLLYVLKTHGQREDRYVEREEKYIRVIETLTKEIKLDIEVLKEKILGGK